ncbi:uncharacterized protein LOC121750956 isoform X1 [Salvia splendens]|uniref:uncharacterized protein LOC121750956 isoform X1 n=1 Tax=Salvia splendens TaxID=180675 RepID=UPI001C279BEA|nr:uncharacterized protein LOC121750956 isoform X1 [Salvia splendens]
MEAQPTSIASLKKKRKQQDSQPEKHLAKHVCREKVEGDEPAKGCESEPESTNSNSFHSNCEDSFMCSDDETDGGFQETCTSDEPTTSSASWAGTSSGDSPYSSENISTSEPESLSMNEDQHDQHDVGFRWEGHAEIELYTDKELEDLLYSNGAAPGGTFILSSGRWSVDQVCCCSGARAMQEEGKKKLTIDNEFEQFFSMLML